MIGLRPPTVVKLGGSLTRDGAPDGLIETITELVAAGHELVVVPGGGAFADAVRRECSGSAISPTAAHWMAILAMDQMAYRLAGRTRNGRSALKPSRVMREAKPRIVRSAAAIVRVLERRQVPILAPFRWLRVADPLPHSWDVTSDSIAAWTAAQLGARRLVLLKSVDGLTGDCETLRPAVARTAIDAAERETGVVDRHFAHALAAATECWIINGRRPERLRALVERDTTIGTVIHGSTN